MKSKTIQIEPFNRQHILVDGLKRIINNDYHSLFKAVIAQGSVGNNEEVRYSDFDGVLVLKDEKVNHELLAGFIKDSTRLINSYDPLQHHGWYIISESDLLDFNPTILPLEVFEHAACIYPFEPLRLNFKVRSKVDWIGPAKRMLRSIENKTKQPDKIRGMFLLKSFLSEVMLLPTLIYQAKEKKGIFKKDSFPVMQDLYSPEAWRAIEIASDIRIQWHYKSRISNKIFTSLKNKRGLKKPVRNYLAPAIPAVIQKELHGGFKEALERLIEESKTLLSHPKRIS